MLYTILKPAGVPVLPVAHTGTRRIFVGRSNWRPRVAIQIGEPYLPQVPAGIPRKAALKIVTEELMQRIASMMPAGERGEYAVVSGKELVLVHELEHSLESTDV